jgi:hypothetical protein
MQFGGFAVDGENRFMKARRATRLDRARMDSMPTGMRNHNRHPNIFWVSFSLLAP